MKRNIKPKQIRNSVAIVKCDGQGSAYSMSSSEREEKRLERGRPASTSLPPPAPPPPGPKTSLPALSRLSRDTATPPTSEWVEAPTEDPSPWRPDLCLELAVFIGSAEPLDVTAFGGAVSPLVWGGFGGGTGLTALSGAVCPLGLPAGAGLFSFVVGAEPGLDPASLASKAAIRLTNVQIISAKALTCSTKAESTADPARDFELAVDAVAWAKEGVEVFGMVAITFFLASGNEQRSTVRTLWMSCSTFSLGHSLEFAVWLPVQFMHFVAQPPSCEGWPHRTHISVSLLHSLLVWPNL